MRRQQIDIEVRGPWSLATSRAFWEGFTPAALPAQGGSPQRLSTVFRVEADWSRAEASVTQEGGTARITVCGDGDLEAAAAQVRRFLPLDIDARTWPDVADRDPVLAEAQTRLPGLRPCGFHSPYEAAAWAVLSQRVRIVQAARLRQELITGYGDAGAFPAPQALRTLELDLPGRKSEYLRAVADAALEGRLDGAGLRTVAPDEAIRLVQEILGLGPFAAELVGRRTRCRTAPFGQSETDVGPTGGVQSKPSPGHIIRCRDRRHRRLQPAKPTACQRVMVRGRAATDLS